MDVPFDSPDVLLFTTGRFRNHFWFFFLEFEISHFLKKHYLTISDRRLIAGNSRIDTYRVFIFYRVFWQFRTLLIELNRFPWHRSDWLVPSFVVNTTLILKISQYYLVFFWTNIYHREKKTRQRISLAKNRLFFVFREFKSCRKSSKWLTGFYLETKAAPSLALSLFLFDLVFRTRVTLRDWEARWPFRNVYCYFFFSKWMPPEIGIGRVLHVVLG